MPSRLLIALFLHLPLLVFAKETPRSLEYGNYYRSPNQETLDFLGDRLGRCFFLVTLKQKKLTLSDIGDRYPYLQNYLRGSVEVDYSTGKEAALREKIMAAPEASVSPLQLFAWSLKLNQGYLFEAILTIHQLLRNEARFYRDWVHDYPSSKEKMIEFFNQFIDIRGDLEERGPGFHGDHRGSWYRFWGTMLDYLSNVAPWSACTGSACTVLNSTSWLDLAKISGNLTSGLAEFVKPIIMYGVESDPRKAEINQVGYDAMDSMIRQAGKAMWNDEKILWYQNRCDRLNYLVPKK